MSIIKSKSVYPPLRDLYGLFDATGFAQGLLVLRLWLRVGHYPGSGLDIDLAVFDNQGANGDGHVHVSGIGKITDRAAVNLALAGFQFINDFHGPDFRGPGQSTRWENRPKGVYSVLARLKLP